MTPLIVVAALAGGLLLVSLVFRINAIFLFVAFATGALLSQHIGDSANLAISGFVKGGHADMVGPLFLLWVPIALAIMFLRKSLPSSSLPLQIVPIVLSSAAAAMLTLKYLSVSFQQSVYATPIGRQVNNAQDLIIAGAGVTTFLLILLIGRPHSDDGGKHHKRR